MSQRQFLCGNFGIYFSFIMYLSFKLIFSFLLYRSFLTATMPEPKPFERLPGNIKPLHYDITLQPNLVKCVFQGSEVVDIEVRFHRNRRYLELTGFTLQQTYMKIILAKFSSQSSICVVDYFTFSRNQGLELE